MSRKTDKYGDKSYINAEALLSFDGTDDSVNFGNVTINDASDFTLEFIISLDDLIASSNTILEKADGNNRILITYNTANNQVRFNLRDGSGNFQQIEINPALGELFHFFCTYNATTSLFEIRSHYENVSETYVEGNFGNSGDLVVGANTVQNATFFNGNIGLFRIYDTVLTSSQELQVRKNPYTIPSTLHANVTAEYIPPRSYYKDTGNIYGKGTNAILWFDSVEQYNDAKGSPLTANHGVLTGWSDSEVTAKQPFKVFNIYEFNAPDSTEPLLDQATTDGYTSASGDALNALGVFIDTLKKTEIWNLLDVAWLPATNGDVNFALYNIIDPSIYKASQVGTPTFTSLEGFTGVGTSYINSNWNPDANANNYALSNSSVSCYVRQSPTNTNSVILGVDDNSTGARNRITFSNRFSSSFGGFYRINSIDLVEMTNDNTAGFHHINRIGSESTSTNLYINGVLDTKIGSALEIARLPNDDIFFLSNNALGTPSAYANAQISFVSFGANLTDKQNTFYNAIQQYMTAIGKEV